jgi:tetratricopeptide (TPR) repeat protein
LSGDYERAVSAYRECMKWCKNDDSVVAAVDWLYMTYRRMNKEKAAKALLTLIKENMNLLENHSYHRRLLMYKGLKTPGSLLEVEKGEMDPGLTFATQGYGVGNWYYYNGNKDKAVEIFKKVLKSNIRAAFGYIAAEVDLNRMKSVPAGVKI